MQRHFERDLDDLKSILVEMISLVLRQIDDAARALLEGDVSLAAEVIARDHQVDAYDNRVEELCQKTFALTQPVATDLRLLMAALKINNQLERIGDIAVNIAERVEPLAVHGTLLRTTKLAEMLQIARIMVSDSVAAFIHSNPALATRVLESDDMVDNLDRDNFHQLVAQMKARPAFIDASAHMLILSRHIERLADHATNIAEDVIFLVEAKIVKHSAYDDKAG